MQRSVNSYKKKSVEFRGVPTLSDTERTITINLVSHSVGKDFYVKEGLRYFHSRLQLDWFSADV